MFAAAINLYPERRLKCLDLNLRRQRLFPNRQFSIGRSVLAASPLLQVFPFPTSSFSCNIERLQLFPSRLLCRTQLLYNRESWTHQSLASPRLPPISRLLCRLRLIAPTTRSQNDAAAYRTVPYCTVRDSALCHTPSITYKCPCRNTGGGGVPYLITTRRARMILSYFSFTRRGAKRSLMADPLARRWRPSTLLRARAGTSGDGVASARGGEALPDARL
jgi:hypothetical protein